jgi:hypothetical protein
VIQQRLAPVLRGVKARGLKNSHGVSYCECGYDRAALSSFGLLFETGGEMNVAGVKNLVTTSSESMDLFARSIHCSTSATWGAAGLNPGSACVL